MIGQIVMTSYNSKTYRIDEVNYNETPRGTFPIKAKDGTVSERSYLDYYLEVSVISLQNNYGLSNMIF